MQQKPDYEALIIGGGPAGATAALLLARAGWSVAMVEKTAFPRRKVCGEFLSATNLPLLEDLGILDEFLSLAGPSVEQVGFFCGPACLQAPMPRPKGTGYPFGRALGRDRLDALLLDRACGAGTTLFQPYRAVSIDSDRGLYQVHIKTDTGAGEQTLSSRVIIAAHGSWEPGSLPTQPPRRPARPSDLFGFKARFRGSSLAGGLMPLLCFPGGYGGMAHTDDGCVSLSCCVRRDKLAALRKTYPHASAAQAVLQHIQSSCAGVRAALAGAELEDKWLTVGPIQPGIRVTPAGGIFRVGNAAGEAHPAIAEGISIAIQSAQLLAGILIPRRDEILIRGRVEPAARQYARLWRRHFAIRIYASALFASVAMNPRSAIAIIPIIQRLPSILTWGARWSGKAKPVRSAGAGSM